MSEFKKLTYIIYIRNLTLNNLNSINMRGIVTGVVARHNMDRAMRKH